MPRKYTVLPKLGASVADRFKGLPEPKIAVKPIKTPIPDGDTPVKRPVGRPRKVVKKTNRRPSPALLNWNRAVKELKIVGKIPKKGTKEYQSIVDLVSTY